MSPIGSSWSGRRAPHSATVGPWSSTQRSGKRQRRFAEALPRELVELVDRGQILAEALALEFRVDLAQIVALESGRLGGRLRPAEEAAAQRAVAQNGEVCAFGVGQHVRLDFALEEVVGRLHGIEPGHGAEGIHLRGRVVAERPEAFPPGLALLLQVRAAILQEPSPDRDGDQISTFHSLTILDITRNSVLPDLEYEVEQADHDPTASATRSGGQAGLDISAHINIPTAITPTATNSAIQVSSLLFSANQSAIDEYAAPLVSLVSCPCMTRLLQLPEGHQVWLYPERPCGAIARLAGAAY